MSFDLLDLVEVFLWICEIWLLFYLNIFPRLILLNDSINSSVNSTLARTKLTLRVLAKTSRSVCCWCRCHKSLRYLPITRLPHFLRQENKISVFFWQLNHYFPLVFISDFMNQSHPTAEYSALGILPDECLMTQPISWKQIGTSCRMTLSVFFIKAPVISDLPLTSSEVN